VQCFSQDEFPASPIGRLTIMTLQAEAERKTRTMSNRRYKLISVALIVAILAISGTVLFAQSMKVQGLIKARNGAQMVLQTSDQPKMVVILTDATQVQQVQGMMKARRKNMGMAALIPGLAVQVQGSYNAQNQLVADKILFKGDDLEQAQAIQAGMHATAAQTQKNQQELEQQNAALAAQNQALQQQQQQLTAQQAEVAKNKAAIASAVARFGQLDDYYIMDEVTVYFANGQIAVDPKYAPQVTALCEKAKTIAGYMIQVQGYASSVGSVALNQKLSEDRANNVANIVLQQGHIPMTNMLAPGAMGESRQVGSDKTAEGQAENRRVVVRVLQNKGIAGT
jgi:outer membrane protein OmpA-like peptidoglycan-associated protein